ncbi:MULTISPECIES: hypothetical protein, partial [unclassified Pseudomonas]
YNGLIAVETDRTKYAIAQHCGKGGQELTLCGIIRAKMILVPLVPLNGHDPNVYLKEALTRLTTLRASE